MTEISKIVCVSVESEGKFTLSLDLGASLYQDSFSRHIQGQKTVWHFFVLSLTKKKRKILHFVIYLSFFFSIKIQFFALNPAETAPYTPAGVSELFSGHVGHKPAEPPAVRP